jgi:hypothetical protein
MFSPINSPFSPKHKERHSSHCSNEQEELSAMNDQSETQSPAPSNRIQPSTSTQTNYWVNDPSVSALSTLIMEQLQRDHKSLESGEKTTPYHLTISQDIHNELCQQFRFNIIRHQGGVSTIRTLKLLKSFVSILCDSDTSLLILPYSTSK